MTKKQIEAELRLFKSYTIDEDINDFNFKDEEEKLNFIAENIYKKGLYFKELPSKDVLEIAIKLYGKDGEKWNQTFHKSFNIVKETPIESLIMQQVVHYFTTYGFESLGIFNDDLVYIPHEKLEIPEIKEDIPLIIIHNIDIDTLQQKIMNLLTSNIALSNQTIEDIMCLSDYIPKNEFDLITNREVKIALYDKYNIVPSNNIEFLRYMIYKLTNSTLLINNDATFKALKEADTQMVYCLLNTYLKGSYSTETRKNYIKLAEIFLRYKEIFLALKRSDKRIKLNKIINSYINKIAKLAKTYHKSINPNVLDTLSNIQLLSTYEFNKKFIISELQKVSVFRLVRILNGLTYRINAKSSDAITYKIRNGKAYTKPINIEDEDKTEIQKHIIRLIKDEIYNRLNPILKDKVIYIPDNIIYMVPQSEKQFDGNIPQGSYINIKKDKNVVIGVHWKNLNDNRVDLDLHLQNKDEQYGWNTSYKSYKDNVFISGDMTNAPLPEGATEVMYIGHTVEDRALLLTLNDYTQNNKIVPYEFVIAYDTENLPEISHSKYVLDPNNIIVSFNKQFEKDEIQTTLGLVKINKDQVKFYFNNFAIGNSIVTRQDNIITQTYAYLNKYAECQYTLNELLNECGAKVINTETYAKTAYYEKLENGNLELIDDIRVKELKEHHNDNLIFEQNTQVKADIDLSLNAITKESLINLLIGGK